MSSPSDPETSDPLFASHPRTFEQNRYVYPVLSRRAGGISIGVNLNPDKTCNFNCIYCQVDRSRPGRRNLVRLDRLKRELKAAVQWAASGEIYNHPNFCHTPAGLRRLNDIALSGDGEPTLSRRFEQVVALCAEFCRGRGLKDLKLLLLTNASLLNRPAVRRGLEILDAADGQIWAKLDAGTEQYYRLVARTAVPYPRILDNLLAVCRVRPIVIQSLFMRIKGQPPPAAEQEAYCERLGEILARGGRIELVQIHTVARPPAEPFVSPLANSEIDALAELVRRRTGLAVAPFYAP
ncbi:MAG: radical SAM protein [Thermoguttaceae bacterium]